MGYRNILFLRQLHGNLHELYINYKKKLHEYCFLLFPLTSKVFVIGTPEHTNLGDSAIVIAQMAFLEKCGISHECIKEITFTEFKQQNRIVKRCIGRKDLITQLGGGNMGNQWMNEELLHREITEKFPENPMVIFPQTIYYTQTEQGEREKLASKACYNGQKDLVVVAREKSSYETMRTLYFDAQVLLTPDVVLSATMDTFGAKEQTRSGVMLCMRNDPERSMTDNERSNIELSLRECGYTYRITDMHSDVPVTKHNRAECVKRKMNEFSKSELVITDRLHGMVFAALTGTPCIVFSNYNYKVSGTYEWIKYLPYVKYAENIEEMKQYIPQLLNMKNCKYDKTPLLPYFNKLAEVVKQKCH